jgi:DNA-binding PadR family transcriptional regulator
MKIPKLTDPQYRVLSLLQEGEIRGGSLRERLESQGQRSIGPVFDRFMARLEDTGYVKGRYEQRSIGIYAITERIYAITRSGVQACTEFQEFAVSPCGVRLLGT